MYIYIYIHFSYNDMHESCLLFVSVCTEGCHGRFIVTYMIHVSYNDMHESCLFYVSGVYRGMSW